MANNRWDFSDILLQQKAGQYMGQAYAGLGQQAGDVFKQMGEQTKQNSIMEGKVKSSAGFLKSGVDMLQRQADDETKKTGRISEQTAQLLNQAQSSWKQLNDPSIGLYQRHAIAENSANNIINIMHLGSSVMQNNLAQQQLASGNIKLDQERLAWNRYLQAHPNASQAGAVQGYANGAGAQLPQGGMSGISNAWNNQTGQAPTAGVPAQVPQSIPQQGATGVSPVDLQKLGARPPGAPPIAPIARGQQPVVLPSYGAQATQVQTQEQMMEKARDSYISMYGKWPTEQQLVAHIKLLFPQQGNLPQKYQTSGNFSLNGKFIGVGVRDQTTGEFGLYDPKTKKITPLPQGAEPTTATAQQREILPMDKFQELGNSVIAHEGSLRNFKQYLTNVNDSAQGIANYATDIVTKFKTFFDQPLSRGQIAQAMAKSEFEGLLGASKLSVVGPGTMTEQDAIRVIRRLGGNPDSLMNKELVAQALSEIYSSRYKQYEYDLGNYNSQVEGFYGEHGGHPKIRKVKWASNMAKPADDEREGDIPVNY